MTKLVLIFITGLVCSLTLSTASKAQDVALKLNLGSLGAGAEVVYSLSDRINVRAGGNFLDFTQSWDYYSTSDFDLSTDIRLRNATLLADWYPFAHTSMFRLSGGIVLNMNNFKGTLTPVRTFNVGGDVYSPEDLGIIEVDFNFPKLAPYLAMGFGNPVGNSAVGVNIDVGVFYQQSPGIDFTAHGLLQPTESQAPVMENNLSWANLYPVLTMSIYYNF